MKPIIVVTKRSHDYHACLEGRPGFWGCGPTLYAAVGNLVMIHKEEFGIDYRFGSGPVDE